MSLSLSPADALAMFKASISDYSRFGFGADHGRSEIDLLDVLKGRVVAGQPIFVMGNPQGVVGEAIDATHRKIAEETGMPVRVVQVVELPTK